MVDLALVFFGYALTILAFPSCNATMGLAGSAMFGWGFTGLVLATAGGK